MSGGDEELSTERQLELAHSWAFELLRGHLAAQGKGDGLVSTLALLEQEPTPQLRPELHLGVSQGVREKQAMELVPEGRAFVLLSFPEDPANQQRCLVWAALSDGSQSSCTVIDFEETDSGEYEFEWSDLEPEEVGYLDDGFEPDLKAESDVPLGETIMVDRISAGEDEEEPPPPPLNAGKGLTPVAVRVTEYLDEHPAASLDELAEALGSTRSYLSFIAARQVSDGVLERQEGESYSNPRFRLLRTPGQEG